MASYAAVVSLLHVVDRIQRPSGRWILLNTQQIQSLHERVSFFLDFLECISDKLEAEELVTQMADACYAAEVIIKSFVSAQVLPSSVKIVRKTLASSTIEIQSIIDEMDVIQEKAKNIVEVIKDQKAKIPLSTVTGPSRQPPAGKSSAVGLDDALFEIMDKLTGHVSKSKLQTIPIVGMGGIGKTTLALNIYNNPCVVEHFDTRAWVTISQEYTEREILLAISKCVMKNDMKESSDEQLGECIYKSLFGRRYLIVMDDVWDIEAWMKVRTFLPDNDNGSGVIITTRLASVAKDLGSNFTYQMNLFKEDESWDLLRDTVFSGDICPNGLEKIGKRIAKSCRGLPLAITIIGGLLAKLDKKLEYWEQVAENLNSIVISENEDHCFRILHLSYKHLPLHLKPCFLYLSKFREDEEIRVSKLIKLWVAEGFLKPINGESLEDVACEYLNDLIDRNLVLVHERGSTGIAKTCVIHDLLRDLSLREARRENFLRTTRVCDDDELLHSLQSSFSTGFFVRMIPRWLSVRFKFFQELDAVNQYSPEEIMQLVNSRYLSFEIEWELKLQLIQPLLWELQTLIVQNEHPITLPCNFWEMTQLRHVQFHHIILPEPLESQSDIMEN